VAFVLFAFLTFGVKFCFGWELTDECNGKVLKHVMILNIFTVHKHLFLQMLGSKISEE